MTTTLVADVGGSNTRLAVAGRAGRPEHVHALANDSVPGLEAAIAAYLEEMDRIDRRPDAAVLAVAGPVEGRRITLTNRAWQIDLDALADHFAFRYVHALNDFEALAWALPWFEPEDVRFLGPSLPARNGPKAVLGPGTGLGVGCLVPEGHSWFALATEEGHRSFGPSARDEWPVFERILEETPAVSAETVLSGPGLERIYRALHPGRPALAAHKIENAARNTDPAAVAAVDLFVRLLGRYAGDIALTFKAVGGVYIAGGVAAKLGHRMDAKIFRKAFVMHPPHEPLLEAIPTFLITCKEPGLFGCAAYAAHVVDEY
jgi:glucokinase